MMGAPKVGRTKSERIQYAQFLNWSSWLDMAPWTKDVYFVPEGYEHPLRRDNEYDRGNHHILDNAPAFLVIMNDEKDARVDYGWYVVRRNNGEFYAYSPEEFKDHFDSSDDPAF